MEPIDAGSHGVQGKQKSVMKYYSIWSISLTLESLSNGDACYINKISLLEEVRDIQLLPWSECSDGGLVLKLQRADT